MIVVYTKFYTTDRVSLREDTISVVRALSLEQWCWRRLKSSGVCCRVDWWTVNDIADELAAAFFFGGLSIPKYSRNNPFIPYFSWELLDFGDGGSRKLFRNVGTIRL